MKRDNLLALFTDTKHDWKSALLITFVCIVFYSLRLTLFPIFADEAIYLNWGSRVITGQENPFISMVDGKQPLFMWLVGITSLAIPNLLLAGRLVSVKSFGLLAFGVWYLLKKYVNQKIAWYTLLLLLFSPLLVFHGRMGLIDMLFTVFVTFGVLVWSIKELKLRGILTGICFGLAFWTKTPVLFLLPYPLLSWGLLERNFKSLKQAITAVIIVCLFIFSLKVSVWFPNLFSRSEDFTFSISQVLQGQVDQILPNFLHLWQWLGVYQTWPLLLLGVSGIIMGIINKQRWIIYLGLSLLLFVSPFIVLGKVLAPRYYLFVGVGLVIGAAYCLSLLPHKIQTGSFIILLLFLLTRDYLFVTDPVKSPMPLTDQKQYLMDWSSGIGIKEAGAYFDAQAEKGKILVLTEGSFGTLPDGLFVLLDQAKNKPNIEIVGVGSAYSDNFKEQIKKSKTEAVYYLGNNNRISDESRQKMTLIRRFAKKDDGAPLELYRVPLNQ